MKTNKKAVKVLVVCGVVFIVLMIFACVSSGENGEKDQDSNKTQTEQKATNQNSDTKKNDISFENNCDTYCKDYLEPELVSVDNEGVTYKIKCTNNTEDKNVPKYTQIEIKYFDYDGQKSYINTKNKNQPIYPTNYKVFSNDKEDVGAILYYGNIEEEAYIRYKKTDITNVEDYKKLKVYFDLKMNRTSAWDGKNKVDTFENIYFSVK